LFYIELAKARGLTSEEEKKEFVSGFMAGKGSDFCRMMESKLDKNGGKFLVGGAVSPFAAGLPEGLFSNQKYQFGQILGGLAMKHLGIF
jgi:hypothetical protein